MEDYRTEEEQVEALRRWWNENGRSTVVAVIVALAAGFGWQSWQANEAQQQERASDVYQSMLRAISKQETSSGAPEGAELAEQLKNDYSGSTYAQFAALHLAAMAVNDGKLPEAEKQLRWVLSKAPKGGDTAQVAQLRLARVLAASGDSDQALAILAEGGAAYEATYAAAEGDILLAAGRKDEARDAYGKALALVSGNGGTVNLPALQQKMQSLAPIPARSMDESSIAETAEIAPTSNDLVDVPEE